MECVDVEEMYQNYAKPVYYFLLSLSHSPDVAEELTAETFYQAIRCINRYDGSCPLKSWLFQISKHLWLRYCRKARQETPQAVSDLAAESCTMEEAAIDGEEKISFYKKLSALDEPYKTVVFLRVHGRAAQSQDQSRCQLPSGTLPQLQPPVCRHGGANPWPGRAIQDQ